MGRVCSYETTRRRRSPAIACSGRDVADGRRSWQTRDVAHEVFRSVDFPFPDDEFPANVGAVVQRTVLDGREPARVVIHDAEGDWCVGDGINDPNERGACVVACLHCIVTADPAIASLATLPVGYQARRSEADESWVLSPHAYEDELD